MPKRWKNFVTSLPDCGICWCRQRVISVRGRPASHTFDSEVFRSEGQGHVMLRIHRDDVSTIHVVVIVTRVSRRDDGSGISRVSSTTCWNGKHDRWLNTGQELQQIPSFSGRPENSDWVLQWWSITKCILKHT